MENEKDLIYELYEDEFFTWDDDSVIQMTIESIEDDETLQQILLQELSANDLADIECFHKYDRYSPENIGCSQEKPFVLSTDNGDYVRLEYDFIDVIFERCSRLWCKYELKQQTLITTDDGRKFDVLEYEVVNLFRSNSYGESHIESYWFDITNGFDAMSKRTAKYRNKNLEKGK